MFNINYPTKIINQFYNNKLTKIVMYLLILPLLMLTLVVVLFHLYYNQKIFPNVHISSTNVSGLTKDEAVQKISSVNIPNTITIYNSNTKFDIPLKDINLVYDYNKTVEIAYLNYRDSGILENSIRPLGAIFKSVDVPFMISVDRQALRNNLSVIAEQITEPSVQPSVVLTDSGVVVNKGETGTDLNIDELENQIISNLTNQIFSDIHANTYLSDPTISEETADDVKHKAELLVGRSLTLSLENIEYNIDDKQLVSFLGFADDYDKNSIRSFINQLRPSVERDPQNPIFVFSNGKVTEFSPAKNGIKIKEDDLINLLERGLESLLQGQDALPLIKIPVNSTPPDYQTSDINDMGINVLLGRGTSLFKHSIPSRIHNILLASSHFNGVLVKPGEVFSFNDTVGDVSQLTGYEQAYIIRDGKTVLGDGGGLCQVSTTLFRAALDAGLPIVERRAHSYRVGYYEQDSPPGIDATVYSPTTDLKFKNDTPNYLLIQTVADAKTSSLVFEIYGTLDGRVSNITKPVVYDVTPPPEDLYIDDPTLPSGQVKQIDWKAWGAKVKFDYSVERNGEIIYEKTFYSNYRPWQSVFLRGTAPAT